MDIYSIPVVFEVESGGGRADAAHWLAARLRTVQILDRYIESWWLPEAQDKHADGNGKAAMHLVFEGPADQIVEPAALRKGDRVKVRFGAADSATVDAGDIGTIVNSEHGTLYVRMDKPRAPGLTLDGGYHWLMSADSLEKVVAEPKPGDRVRVTYEATWREASDTGLAGWVRSEHMNTCGVPAGATVEVLAPAPKPVYVNHDATEPQYGDVVRYGDTGLTLTYDAYARCWRTASATPYAVFAPLTLLVREGKQVAQ